jgi:pyruvate formate lyase activating enzyme
MLIGGIHTLTLLDYPDKVACIIFTAGCNMRCSFCHNPEMVLPEKIRERMHDMIPEEKFFNFLEKRKDKLEGVVVSGGEPTMHSDLVPFIRKIKAMGFLVKLDTNGTNPEVLSELLEEELVDYIAMDVKASKGRYDELTCSKNNFAAIKHSRDIIKQSRVDHEFRTTVIKEFHTVEEMKEIAHFCRGAKRYTIQNFRPQKVLDPNFKKYHGVSKKELEMFKLIAGKKVDDVRIQD